MLYDITLRISYAFGETTASGRQVLRVFPRQVPGRQRVHAAVLTFKPAPLERRDTVDFFGNPVVEAAYREAWKSTSFEMRARVERTASAAALDFSPRLDDLAQQLERYQRLDAASPHHFTGPSPRIADDPAILDYARGMRDAGRSVRDIATALNQALYRDMRFDPDATDVNTPAGEAFRHRHGVCQDFAHIMITGLRGLGIPAGYASGYLRTIPPEGKPRLEGADAMHAWVTAWCGEEEGWVEFDPTNGMLAGNDHILVAIGRDYSDVAPVSGVLKTAGLQETKQAVDVVPVTG